MCCPLYNNLRECGSVRLHHRAQYRRREKKENKSEKLKTKSRLSARGNMLKGKSQLLDSISRTGLLCYSFELGSVGRSDILPRPSALGSFGKTVQQNETTHEEADQVTLYSYKVQSTITSRMATTMIQSKVVNNSPQPQNVVFDVQIPKGAFISNFSMSRALDMENFRTEVNVLPGAKVQFELHYQEVKWRKLGSYEHRIYLQPGRLAKHLEVDVWVIEPQGIRFLHVPDTFEGHFDGVPVVSKGQAEGARLLQAHSSTAENMP
ncbi:hypothetical protein H8959_011875 [Pygathrix nigripes]